MNIITIRELFKNTQHYIDKDVEVCGWVRSVRASKAFGFIVVNDGTFLEPLQVVFHDTMPNFDEVSKLNVGSALIVRGTLVATPDAKQPFEIQAKEVEIEGASTPDYPLQKKRHTLEYLRTISHLRARTNTFQAVFRVRSLIAFAIHSFFMERNFVYVHTPIITGSDCEGAGEIFHVTTHGFNSAKLSKDEAESIVDRSDKFYRIRSIAQLNVIKHFLNLPEDTEASREELTDKYCATYAHFKNLTEKGILNRED